MAAGTSGGAAVLGLVPAEVVSVEEVLEEASAEVHPEVDLLAEVHPEAAEQADKTNEEGGRRK